VARDQERRPWLRSCCLRKPDGFRKNLARPAGLEPATLGLAYPLPLSRLPAGGHLGSGPSLHHCRCCTYGLYGSPRRMRIRARAPYPRLLRAFGAPGPPCGTAPGFLGITISATC